MTHERLFHLLSPLSRGDKWVYCVIIYLKSKLGKFNYPPDALDMFLCGNIENQVQLLCDAVHLLLQLIQLKVRSFVLTNQE